MILDLFAGPGGWDEGARLAGYRGLLVGIEHDTDACRTAVAAGHARIRADVAAYPLGVFAAKVTGLIASPPCPTFSTAGDGAGKQDLPNVLRLIADYAAGREPGLYEWADERSALTAQPMRYAAALRPRWIALEQVPPVLPIWQYLADRLRGLGYNTWCGILSAEEYGVAQTRKRALLAASLASPVGPPAPTHQAYVAGQPPQVDDDLFGSPLPPPVSMSEALGWGLPDRPSWTVSGGGTETGGAEVFANAGNRQKLREVVALRNGNQARAATRAVDQPAGTVYFGGKVNAVDWVLERPSTTVCGDARIGRTGHKDRDKGEAQFEQDSVRVSVTEAGVLQSFRADYPWRGTKTKQYQQVGNAVPPLLAAAVLRQFVAADAGRAAA